MLLQLTELKKIHEQRLMTGDNFRVLKYGTGQSYPKILRQIHFSDASYLLTRSDQCATCLSNPHPVYEGSYVTKWGC